MRPVVALALATLGAATAPAGAIAAPAPDGGALFASRCSVCHSQAVDGKGVGPTLAGVVGRKRASVPGYNYSPALAKATGVWTPQLLDTFLTSPKAAFPGTRMIAALTDAGERKAVIAYLAKPKK